MKRVDVGGKSYRVRRGKLVEIPEEWVGNTTHPQSIRKRESKGVRKVAMRRDNGGPNEKHPRNWAPRHSAGKINGD